MNNLEFELFGASHEKRVGFRIYNIPKNEKIDIERLQEYIGFRSSSGKQYTTKRKETDKLNILTGIENNITTGDVIEGFFENKDTDSGSYSKFKDIPRPSHIDYVSFLKYGQDHDLSGSSHFSGRMSVGIAAMGAIAVQMLERRNIYISSLISRIKNIKLGKFDDVNLDKKMFENIDKNFPILNKNKKKDVEHILKKVINNKDSVGGEVQIAIVGDLAGIGGAYFDRLESKISKNIFSIPGVRAVEFGNGIESSFSYGSNNNDVFFLKDGKVKTLTNNSGGINGGIANGMPIIVNAYVKPTASIGKKQRTLNIKTGEMYNLEIEGRHDPAFLMRIPIVIESMVALSILDEILLGESLRDKIDILDTKIVKLLQKRFEITDEIGRKKAVNGEYVADVHRENNILERISQLSSIEEICDIYENIFKNSKLRQEKINQKYYAKYGLIGAKLGHSYSPEIHQGLGGYRYGLFEVDEDEIENFLNRGFKGLNVTIPYKQKVIPYLDGLTTQAKKIGAVNVIQFIKGKKYGFNTDYYGFKSMIYRKSIQVNDKNILVLGTGASSKTVSYVLNSMGAKSINFVSRNGDINYSNLYDYKDTNVIVNTTPVGMYPDNNECKIDISKFPLLESVIDLVYNPIYSRLILDAMLLGKNFATGFSMLMYQAKKSIEIFKNIEIYDSNFEKVFNDVIKSKLNIVLVGMPGCGKSSIGKKVAERLGKTHIDMDREFQNYYRINTSGAIEIYGVDKFREMETDIAKMVGKKTGTVISTGGGVVTMWENYFHLKQNSVIIEIDRNVEQLSTRNRPLSQGGIDALIRLKSERKSMYEKFSDFSVVNDSNFSHTVKKIVRLFRNMSVDL